MAEYEHLASSLLANEEMGERRIALFLTLVAASIAVLGLLSDALMDAATIRLAAAATAVLLVGFGLATVRRLVHRNITTTDYVNGLARIRAYFVYREPGLTSVLQFVPPVRLRRRSRSVWQLGRAGYLEIAVGANSLMAGIALAVSLWQISTPALVGPATVLGVAGAWLGQMWWVRRTYEAESGQAERDRTDAVRWWSGADAGQ